MSNLYLEKLPEEYLYNYVELSSTNDNSYKYFNSIIIAYLTILSASILLIPLFRLYYFFFFENEENNDNTLYIIRGVPGIGKKYFVYSKEVTLSKKEDNYALINFKDYFFNQGEYKFEGKNIGKAENRVMINLLKCINDNVNRIYITGYFEKPWMYSHYKYLAETVGYNVEIIELQCSDENELKVFNERCCFKTPFSKSKACFLNWENDLDSVIQEPYVPYFEGDSLPDTKILTKERLDKQLNDYFNIDDSVKDANKYDSSSDEESVRLDNESDGNEADSESDASSNVDNDTDVPLKYNDYDIGYMSKHNMIQIRLKNVLFDNF